MLPKSPGMKITGVMIASISLLRVRFDFVSPPHSDRREG